MRCALDLISPLFTAWQEQYARFYLPGITAGEPLILRIDGQPAAFQYTGVETAKGAEVMVKLGFACGERKTLCWERSREKTTDLQPREISLAKAAVIGAAGRELQIPAPTAAGQWLAGPFAGFAGFPFHSRIFCERPLAAALLRQVNDGQLFTDYELRYDFADRRRYLLRLRCYKGDPLLEVAEHYALRMNSRLILALNPAGKFDSIVSREWFQSEEQPKVELLARERTRDVLCRLQMPVLCEYFIPNNRGWFALFNQRDPGQPMLGILGLYGSQWEMPVEGMPEIFGCGGTVEWRASLESGRRYWLFCTGPVETKFTPERRLIFHRLHAEFNALRLDEHFDLTGENVFDETCWREDGLFVGDDYHAQAKRRYEALPCLRRCREAPDAWLQQNGSLHQAIFACLLEPTLERHRLVYDKLIERFELWVRQFQGWRRGAADYQKSTIGFSRYLRGMLMGYELLRKDQVLSEEELGKLNAYFVFAARRLLDEGWWPHSRTWKHPDHPESIRDLYTYGGEHKPDRLVWTNCLPNFQSDPLCSLLHLSALFRDHPQAREWQRFALDDLERQLDAYCGQSGAWEESINYALYTFSYFVITFRPVKYRWGIDLFNDERVRRFAGWLCRYFGPFDKRWRQYVWPGVGNAVIPTHGSAYFLAYAAELPEGDPLREDCLAVYQKQAEYLEVSEHYGTVLAAMAPLAPRRHRLRPAASEVMDEVGVAMRACHMQADESYLFQKIGFAKDHYEGDETAFNWYAKGTPFLMDYATYTADVSAYAAHNLVEIPDEDPLRRGYLADHLFTPAVDFTHCEMPVTLKLLWGRVREFAESDGEHAQVSRADTPYFYIGDKNPVGPKCWKVRLLLFVKPDYLALFDRVYGEVPHRYNLHFTGDALSREGNLLRGRGRFDLDLLALVQHPATFDWESGELVPGKARYGEGDKNPHRQSWCRLYNRQDGIYRTLLFAQERGRRVHLEALPGSAMRVVTPEYTDYVFLHNEQIETAVADAYFRGAVGWIRRCRDGRVLAVAPNGDSLGAFGMRIEGRGPWAYNLESKDETKIFGTLPRQVRVKKHGEAI